MRPETSFEPFEPFNYCTEHREPDWRLFDALEVDGCIVVAEEGTGDTYVVGGATREEAEFFTVYGHLITVGCEAITDCSTLGLAGEIGTHFQN
ncbi:hypothetical protein [Rhizobium sp.]|uniref:hypothetical protein n=1 Tax=Rhizobium sp. TaxID=391 RepID=UPI0028A77845